MRATRQPALSGSAAATTAAFTFPARDGNDLVGSPAEGLRPPPHLGGERLGQAQPPIPGSRDQRATGNNRLAPFARRGVLRTGTSAKLGSRDGPDHDASAGK
jgi:hypothetical protein